MLKEIMEQNTTIRKTINPYINNIKDLLKMPDLTKYKRIDIIACGTAMHAGLIAKYLFEQYTNTKCEVFLASEYRYQNNFLNNKVLSIFTLLILLSTVLFSYKQFEDYKEAELEYAAIEKSMTTQMDTFIKGILKENIRK